MQVARPPLTIAELAQPLGNGLPFSVNATVPAAVPALPLGSDTVAVNATPWPCTAVAGADSVVVVDAAVIVSAVADELVERVIEERARGNPAAAESIRAEIVGLVGDDFAKLKPGSPEAMKLKETLIRQGAWSQYLEVGIGPDAEIFLAASK